MEKAMRIHIVGICGTFMGGVALIARELGHSVVGSDLNIYPPMSDVLTNAGIEIRLGFEPSTIDKDVDLVIPANDDALKSVQMVVEFVGECFKEGKSLQGAREQMKKIEEERDVKKDEEKLS